MPKDRYYIDKDLKQGEVISIHGQEAAHMFIIMRKKRNEKVEIINGKGFLAKATVIDASKNSVNLNIENLEFVKEKKQKIILIQSIIKPDRLELILEKCTELGLDEFWLFKAVNTSEIHFSKSKLDRFNNLIIAATKQCGRLYLPKIKIFKSMEDLKDIHGQVFFGHTLKNSQKLIDSYDKNNENIYFIIGPESGFTNNEVNYLENNLKALPVKLNENILRSETAAISAITIISHLIGS